MPRIPGNWNLLFDGRRYPIKEASFGLTEMSVTTGPSEDFSFGARIDPAQDLDAVPRIVVARETFRGVEIVESVLAVSRVEDWSACRSPSRARRRLRQGHQQRVVVKEVPAAVEAGGVIYAHPEIVAKIKAHFSSAVDDELERAWSRFIGGTNAKP